MEGRPARGRGGGWKRGDRGGSSSDSFGGESRGRGRGGGHHRGRGKRDRQRGRGCGGSSSSAEFHHRSREEEENSQEEDDRTEGFSRRKLESNWDRYEESDRKEAEADVPTQRGTDYHVLLESAGDSFTHFRFSEEKEWELDSFATSQMFDMFLDLPALADLLEQIPLHQRLSLEPELVQVPMPFKLPNVTLAPKWGVSKSATFASPPGALKDPTSNQEVPATTMPTSESRVPSTSTESLSRMPVEEEEEEDEELDQLLGLQKPVSGVSGNPSDTESLVPEKACEEVKEKMEEVQDDTKHTPAPVRKEVTEEDLEDWLDSMIS